jgi:hypothetical protein
VSASAMHRPPAEWMSAPRPGEEQKQIRPGNPALEADALLNTHRRAACWNGSARVHFPQKRITALVLDVPEGPERKDRCLPGDESPQDKGVFGPESQIPHAVQLDGVRTREELDHHATSSKTPPSTPSSGTR